MWGELCLLLVHLVVVLLFLLLLSLPLLSAALTLSLADWTTVMLNCIIVMPNCITVMPNCITVMHNCITVMHNCITVIPTFIILSSPPLERSGLSFLFPFTRGELSLRTVASLLHWAVHIKLLHLLAVTRTSHPRVRVGLAAAHLRVLCFHLPLRGLLLSLLLLLLRLLTLLVMSAMSVLTLAVESLASVQFAFTVSFVHFHP